MKKILKSDYLANKFKDFLFKRKVAELCAYHPITGDYIVIDDGMCCKEEDSFWVFVKYRFINKDFGLKFFKSKNKHPIFLKEYPQDIKRIGEFKIYANKI